MTTGEFRRIALSMPGAVEGTHMGHADFRAGGRIFATLGAPTNAWGMIKVGPDDQALLLSAHPKAFQAAAGAWGRAGCTMVRLEAAPKAVIKDAMSVAVEVAMTPKASRRTRRPAR